MLISVHGFGSGKTVSYMLLDKDGNTILDFTSTDVTERVIDSTAGESTYQIDLSDFATGTQFAVIWKTNDAAPWTSSERFNIRTPVFAHGFGSGKTVSYKVIEKDGTIDTDWTTTGVTEVVVVAGVESVYYVTPSEIDDDFEGHVFFKTSDATPLTAAETFALYSTADTTSDWTVKRYDIIKDALQILAVVGESEEPTSNQVEFANVRLNAVMKALQTRGMMVWLQQWSQKTFTASSKKLGTDAETYTCIQGHTASSTNKPITGANYTSVWKKTGSGGTTWVSGSSYTAIGDFDLSASVTNIKKAFIRDGSTDTTLDIVVIDEYFDMADKTTTGTPTMLVFVKKPIPHVYLWPQPDDTTLVLHYLEERRIRDFDTTKTAIDFDVKFVNAVTLQLAYSMSYKYGRKLSDRELLRRDAEEAFFYALGDSRETNETTCFVPAMRN